MGDSHSARRGETRAAAAEPGARLPAPPPPCRARDPRSSPGAAESPTPLGAAPQTGPAAGGRTRVLSPGSGGRDRGSPAWRRGGAVAVGSPGRRHAAPLAPRGSRAGQGLRGGRGPPGPSRVGGTPRLQPHAAAAPSPGLYLGEGPAGRCWRALRLRRFRFSSASVSPAKRWRSGSPPNGLARCGRSAAQRRDWRRLRAPPPPPAAAAPAPLRPPSRGRRSRSPAAWTAAAAAAGRAAGGMRHDPTPGFSMLLFGVSLACYSPSLKSVQDQAYTAAVVLEGKVQSVSPPAGNGSGGGRDPPGSNGGVLVKVLDLWPLNSGGLQREQLISVGSAGSKAPCFKVKRNHRYIFFLEPTEKPLVFKTSFAPLDTSGKNLKKDVGRILCADCGKLPGAPSCSSGVPLMRGLGAPRAVGVPSRGAGRDRCLPLPGTPEHRAPALDGRQWACHVPRDFCHHGSALPWRCWGRGGVECFEALRCAVGSWSGLGSSTGAFTPRSFASTL